MALGFNNALTGGSTAALAVGSVPQYETFGDLPAATTVTSGTVVYAKDRRALYWSNGSSWRPYTTYQADAVGDGTTNDTSAIQAAIALVASIGGGEVLLPPGTFLIDNIDLASTVHLRGSGMGVTTLLANGGDMIHLVGEGTTRTHVGVSDLTIDANGEASTAGLIMEWVEDVLVERVEVTGFSVWGMSFGAYTDGSETNYVVERLTLRDCYFHSPTAGNTYEALLLFNCRHVLVDGCRFTNSTASTDTNAIGVYQVAENVRIANSLIDGWKNGLYYSQSTNNIWLENTNFVNNVNGVHGANQSDNGAFGATHVFNVHARNCTFKANTKGLQFGAVKYATATGCAFDSNIENAVVVDDGNSPVAQQPSHIIFDSCGWRNNNQSGSLHILHPGILFQSVGGDQHVVLNNCLFYDDQGTPTQTHPVVFTGNYTWGQLSINGGFFRSYSGADPITLDSGAALDDTVQAIGVQFLPSGSTVPTKLYPSVMSAGNFFAQLHNKQVGLGALGPGGQAGVELGTDGVLKLFAAAADAIGVSADGSSTALQIDDGPSASNTAMLLQWNDGGTLKTQRVSVGATDSGGSGYRVLRIPNS